MEPTTDHPSTDLRRTDGLGAALAREMRHGWHDGERVRAEQLFARHPELWDQPEAAIDLIYEEFCLRLRGGEEGIEQEILGRFPQWADPLRVMFDCHRRLLQSEGAPPQFPGAGEQIGDFELLEELARGSRGRVFLAAQRALGDRRVVLKLTGLDGLEHLCLARLQHTNIVPLYWAFDDPTHRLRVLCMPYFGRATLATLLERLSEIPMPAWMGQHVLEAIDRWREPSETAAAPAGAARQMLARVTYAQAICWIGACLADALQFAHDRGLVHLDLKPSNVLLAGDGQPMLLDFHLAREPIQAGGLLAEHFGGTPPYMPPEQHTAMQSLRHGEPTPVAVGARADIFALGAMLYESLGGKLPITDQSPPLARVNPRVTTGLSDIIARCVEAEAPNRYPDARSLADDLRRHLTDQPLTGVPNRSLGERWAKWRRRRPSTLRAAAILLLVAGALAVIALGLWSSMHDRLQQARMALFDGQRQMQSGRDVSEAALSFERGLASLHGVPFQSELKEELTRKLALARQLELSGQLHRLADQVRVLYGSNAIPTDRIRSLAAQCVAFWNKRDAILAALGDASGETVRADLQDIAIFAAGLQVQTGSAADAILEQRRRALRILDEAMATLGQSAALKVERRALLAAIGSGALDMSADPDPPPTSAWEHYAVGRAFLAAGNLPRAARELDTARRLDPAGAWPNFAWGVCAFRMGHHDDAIAAFSACIGAEPAIAGFFYNRALAWSAVGRRDDALADYDAALRLDPTHAPAALNRGVLHYQLRHFDQSIADLQLALTLGADPATAHYDLALVHLASDHPALAMQHAQTSLEHNPAHDPARKLRESLQRR